MDNRFIPWTIGFALATFAALVVCLGVGNTFNNACKIYRKNEKLSSTEEGKKLLEIRKHQKIYAYLLDMDKSEEEEV